MSMYQENARFSLQDRNKFKGNHHGGIKVKCLQVRGQFRNLKDYLERDKKRSVGNLYPSTFPSDTPFPQSLHNLFLPLTHTRQLPNTCNLGISGSTGFNHFLSEAGKSWSFVSNIYDSQGIKKTLHAANGSNHVS